MSDSYDESKHPRDARGMWTTVGVVTEVHPDDNKIKVLGVHGSLEAAQAAATARDIRNADEDHGNTQALVEVHHGLVEGGHDGNVDVVSSVGEDGVTVHGVYASVAEARAARAELIKEKWAADGPDMDYADVPIKVEKATVKEWNDAHSHATVNFDNYKFGANPAFEKFYNDKLLAGRKAPFPGVEKANAILAEDGLHIQHSSGKAVIVSGA